MVLAAHMEMGRLEGLIVRLISAALWTGGGIVESVTSAWPEDGGGERGA